MAEKTYNQKKTLNLCLDKLMRATKKHWQISGKVNDGEKKN